MYADVKRSFAVLPSLNSAVPRLSFHQQRAMGP